MDTLIKTVNYIKTRPLKNRFFCRIMRGNEGTVSVTLFCCNSGWLSGEKVVVRVYNFRESATLFLGEENLAYAEQFRKEHFVLS
jgi:hypothetical protein